MKRPDLSEFNLSQKDVSAIRKYAHILNEKEATLKYICTAPFLTRCAFILFTLLLFFATNSILLSVASVVVILLFIRLIYFAERYFSGEPKKPKEVVPPYTNDICTALFPPFAFGFILVFWITTNPSTAFLGAFIICAAVALLKVAKCLWIICPNHQPSGFIGKRKALQMYEDKEKEYNGLLEEKRLCDEAKVLIEKQEARNLAARAADAAEKDKKNARKNIEFWQELDGVTFEREFASLLKDTGFTSISLTATSGDEGIDIWGTDPSGKRCIFQCKAYKDPVVPAQVRELLGSLASVKDKANYAVMVALSGTTAGALGFAKKNEVLIWNGKTLIEMAKTVVF
jgi:HJR/Mrr/RecB family endonuclease